MMMLEFTAGDVASFHEMYLRSYVECWLTHQARGSAAKRTTKHMEAQPQ